MRYLIYSDVHFSEKSSIVNMKGEQHSRRIENLIQSLNWAENQALENKCDEILCLGDFFDKPELNSVEITALKEVLWANLPHTFLIGNHEGFGRDLYYNSTNVLQSTNLLIDNNFEIISKPAFLELDDVELFFIPYYLEEDRKSLSDYINQFSKSKKKKIVFSHNDIKGIHYGAIESKEGFDISDIENNCDLFLNGHVHNSTKFCKNGINLGNLTGQNFSEDASKYCHNVYVLDTSDNSLVAIENPYALNFYKFEFSDISQLNVLTETKDFSVFSIKCPISLQNNLNDTLALIENKIVAKRLIFTTEPLEESPIEINSLAATNHLSEFYNFAVSKLGNDQAVIDELTKVITE